MDDLRTYLSLYKKFHQDCGHVADSKACLAKVYEECKEFIEAYDNGDGMSELVDVMNTSIYAAYMNGIPNPLFAGYLKLEATKVKYRKQKEAE